MARFNQALDLLEENQNLDDYQADGIFEAENMADINRDIAMEYLLQERF